MATIFNVDLRHNLTSHKADSSVGVFGGEENIMKTLKDTKKHKTLIKSSLLTSRKSGEYDNKSRRK